MADTALVRAFADAAASAMARAGHEEVVVVGGRFVRWGGSHLAALGLIAIISALLVAVGRRVRASESCATSLSTSPSAGAEERHRRGCALVILLGQTPLQIYSMIPPNWDPASSLPFQLCDLAWMAAVVALWTRSRVAYGLVFFWGLTLTSQAFLSPVLQLDFPALEFIMFWFMHGVIVVAAIFMTWGLGMRVGWREYAITCAVTLAWAVIMMGFNALAGANYLYVNHKPPRSILDHLGPWPLYVLVEVLVLAFIWALMTWPSARALRRAPR